jgi:Uma2 family endonuclease
MGMPAVAMDWTVERVYSLPPDGNRYEVINGELFVTPAPSVAHQLVGGELHLLIAPYLREHRFARVILAPADVEIDARTVVEPDLFVVPLPKGPLPRALQSAREILLVAEVLSPTTARADRTVKRRLYQSQRIPEYWIVDADARLVERWRPDDTRPELISNELIWSPSSTHPPLTIDLPALFARALDG